MMKWTGFIEDGKTVEEFQRHVLDNIDKTPPVTQRELGVSTADAERYPVLGNIQGRGLFIGVDLVKDPVTREPHTALAGRLPDAMKAEGVLIGCTGRYGNCLKFRPPLVFNEANADETLAALERVLSRV